MHDTAPKYRMLGYKYVYNTYMTGMEGGGASLD